MKPLFYIGILGLTLFEILNVYFIMPMPGSQEMNSLSLAYFLHSSRWIFRIVFVLMIVAGIRDAVRGHLFWIPILMILLACFTAYVFNFRMTADKMFLQPHTLVLKNKSENLVPESRLIIGVEHQGDAKAYPIEFLAYHHQVIDTVGDKPVMVTYCSVCRTGRVFEPIVNGKHEKFRLVGMDHYNAMFEDITTRSWWRQVTGEAVAGKMKGHFLPEVPSNQMTIEKWFELHSRALVMQPDPHFYHVYDSLAYYEKGKTTGRLTGTDTSSWNMKSWVIGVQIGETAKAYDWNALRKNYIINDSIGNKKIIIVLSDDEKSFAAYTNPPGTNFTIRNDTLLTADGAYSFNGQNLHNDSDRLQHIQASQEFWHSWLTFHPHTLRSEG